MSFSRHWVLCTSGENTAEHFGSFRRSPGRWASGFPKPAGLAVQWPQGWQRLPWHSLTRIQQVGDWLLLYPGPDFCYYLNLRQIPAPHTAVDVLALIGKREQSGPAATFASQ